MVLISPKNKRKRSTLFIQYQIPTFAVEFQINIFFTQNFFKIPKFWLFTSKSSGFTKYLDQKLSQFYQNSQSRFQKSHDFLQHILRKKIPTSFQVALKILKIGNCACVLGFHKTVKRRSNGACENRSYRTKLFQKK